ADLQGNSEVILRAPSFPCCVDWLPDGRLLLVSARDGLLLRREPDGRLVTHGDLSSVAKPPAGNELVVDGRGNAYVNGIAFDPHRRRGVCPRNRRSGHPRRFGSPGGGRPRVP